MNMMSIVIALWGSFFAGAQVEAPLDVLACPEDASVVIQELSTYPLPDGAKYGEERYCESADGTRRGEYVAIVDGIEYMTGQYADDGTETGEWYHLLNAHISATYEYLADDDVVVTYRYDSAIMYNGRVSESSGDFRGTHFWFYPTGAMAIANTFDERGQMIGVQEWANPDGEIAERFTLENPIRVLVYFDMANSVVLYTLAKSDCTYAHYFTPDNVVSFGFSCLDEWGVDLEE